MEVEHVVRVRLEALDIVRREVVCKVAGGEGVGRCYAEGEGMVSM